MSTHLERLKRKRAALFAAAGSRCFWCGCGSASTLDHLVPKAKGGGLRAENLVVACWDCNQARGCRSALAFALEHGVLSDSRLERICAAEGLLA